MTNENTKINKPIRLRTLILKHLESINPNVTFGEIEGFENDIKTFIKSVIHNNHELGLVVDCESYIGDLD